MSEFAALLLKELRLPAFRAIGDKFDEVKSFVDRATMDIEPERIYV